MRRFALASVSLAGFVAACAGGDCTQEVTIPIRVDEVCPSPEAAAKRMESSFSAPSIAEPATAELLVPGTICWYLVTFETLECQNFPTREVVLEMVASRGEDPYSINISCDAERVLYPTWLPAPVTTPSEAAEVTLAECPPTSNREFQYQGDRGRVGELASSDFVAGRVLCDYDLHYECEGGGCGTPPSGGLN